MRKALIVGINHYEHQSPLFGCVNDAIAVNKLLAKHGDGTDNFGTRLLTATNHGDHITRKKLKDMVIDLFSIDNGEAVFYFSGHGYIERTGGFLATSECIHGDDGLSMAELLKIANDSKASNKIIMLDCCHSGYAGSDYHSDNSLLSTGTTILTASTKEQYATESGGSGLFTSLLVDALDGAAANLIGKVTPGSVYAHIDRSLGEWQQRPLFKTNIKEFMSLRDVAPPVPIDNLRQITSLFKERDEPFQLDPTFEPERSPSDVGSPDPDPENVRKFGILQRFESVGLVIPQGASKPHMYHAAMESKWCVLTRLGKHYWNLAKNNRLKK